MKVMTRSLSICIVLLFLATHPVIAEELTMEQALELGKSLGSDGQSGLESLATGQNADTVPNYAGTDIPETQYGNNPMAMEDEARTQVSSDETGSFVSDTITTRPQYQFDRQSDPLLTRADAIQENPESVAGSITNEYSGCEASTLTTPPTYAQQTCTEWRQTETHTCTETLQLTCDRPVECDAGGIALNTLQGDMRWDYTYPILTLGAIADNIWGGQCATYDRRTTFQIENINKVNEFKLIQAGFDDWIRIVVNDQLVYVGPYGGDRLEVGSIPFFGATGVWYSASQWGWCELSTSWNRALDIDIKPYLRNGTNTIDMRVVVAGGGEGWMKFKATQYCDCQWSERWESSCDSLNSQVASSLCAMPTRICTEPGETRVISEMEVYRDCWNYQNTYECAAPFTSEESYCQTLRDQGCAQIGSTCTGTMPNGLCESYEQTYQCETSPGTSSEIIDCGGQTLCMDSGCFDTSYAPSEDFGKAAANLGALSEAGNDFNVNTNEIFKGEDLRCSKAILGFSNCCKLDGWGQDLGLDQCSTNEQRLGLARQGGLCHYVGSYCSSRNLFGCTTRKETYCCFKSKLARIIHEQGRLQLGIGWGSAENPNCDGITIEQLQSLDFSLIDFSEFYADAMSQTDSPNAGDMQSVIQNYIQNAYQ